MEKLETLFLEYMGEEEFTHADDMFARFSMVSMDDMSNLIKWALDNGFIRQVTHEGEVAYTRTLAGRAILYGETFSNDTDIPF